jgi:deoxyribose-phosphate aldolase
MLTKQQIAGTIDHTILKAQVTEEEVIKICTEAREFGFASVCVNPVHVPLVKKALDGSRVKTCCVIGFPLGANSSAVKAFETAEAVKNGADEVDMVVNVGYLRAGEVERVEADIRAVVEASGNALVKVILETCYLTDEEKIAACEASRRAGADFVKTSTGFGSGGATAQDVKLMKETVGEDLLVKASGGIRTLQDLKTMLDAGASRIGASAGVAIMKEIDGEKNESNGTGY